VIPALHIVTDDEILRREDFLSHAGRILEAGGLSVALHLRGPRTSGGILYALAKEIRQRASGAGSILLINDRVDLALALDLPGVQLGQRSLPPDIARRLLGPRSLLGLSVHGMKEVGDKGDEVVDFFLVGTLFSSSSHPHTSPGGVALLQEIRLGTTKPLVAIGGITADRVSAVLGAGAHGVAVRGGIWDARDPSAAVRGYLKVLNIG
jgi:thiamine-phosphate pyrophosphorylase